MQDEKPTLISSQVQRGNMTKYFNTTFAPSMVTDGVVIFRTITIEEAKEFLRESCENIANPTHSNSLQAISQLLTVDVRNAKGGKVTLKVGDTVLVAQVSGLPRETREFTDEEIKAAEFEFRLVKFLGS